mmetsp:Transcript_13126/g.34205  ORF Transcript_13126/g.34205 Transcript_13126/m.34205 type:complete len:99 (-) Transcript_13126:281-577(-)
MNMLQLQRHEPSLQPYECVTDPPSAPWHPLGLAPLTLTHILIALALIFVYAERAAIRRAFVLFSAWAAMMTWYMGRRVRKKASSTFGRRIASQPHQSK